MRVPFSALGRSAPGPVVAAPLSDAPTATVNVNAVILDALAVEADAWNDLYRHWGSALGCSEGCDMCRPLCDRWHAAYQRLLRFHEVGLLRSVPGQAVRL